MTHEMTDERVTNWASELMDAYPNTKLDQAAVERWEHRITLLLHRNPRLNELSDAIVWGQAHIDADRYRFTAPGPQDLASWVNMKNYEQSERTRNTDASGKTYRRMTEDETEACITMLKAWRADHARAGDGYHVEQAMQDGYIMIQAGDRLRATDEYWNGTGWNMLGAAAYTSDATPRRMVPYRSTAIRRCREEDAKAV